MSTIDKTPYFSQKTAVSSQKSRKNASFFLKNSLLSSIFGCYLSQKSENFANSSLIPQKNHQSLEVLTNSLHYCERISRESSKTAKIPQKPLQFAEFCVLQHNGRVFLAKLCSFNVHVKEKPLKSSKNCAISAEKCLKNATYACQSEESRVEGSTLCKNASFSSIFAENRHKSREILRNVCAHVAKTLKNATNCGNLVYDVSANDGVAALQLAKNGFHVLALCKNLHFCRIIAQTAKIRGFSSQIDVIYADFFAETRTAFKDADLALLNLLDLLGFEETGCGFESFEPDFAEIVAKTLRICRNLVVLLPKTADISELASIFWKIHEETAGKLPFFSLKCEFVQINAVLEAYVLYIGEISQIKENEERTAFARFLTKDYSADFLEKNSLFLAFFAKMPINCIYRVINQYFSFENAYKDSLYVQFLWICKNEGRISAEDYQILLEFERDFAILKEKRGFLEEKHPQESINPRKLADNIEIFTFSASDARKSAKTQEIKLISSQNSPFFKKFSEKSEKVAEKTESFEEEREITNKNNVSCSFYSGQILNSLSPHSFDKTAEILRNLANERSFVEKNEGFQCPLTKKSCRFY